MSSPAAPTMNLARMLTLNAVRFADREALVFEDRRWTYAELNAQVNAVAAGMAARGIQRASRVAMVADNVPEFIILALALSRLGAVFVPLNYRLTAGELAGLIERAGVVAVASVPEFAELTSAAVASLPQVRRISLEPISDAWLDLAEIAAGHRGEVVPDVPLGGDALQRIMYTSGTTSLPKGVLLTHGNVAANIHAQVVELALSAQDRILAFAPLYHVGGLDLPGFAIWQVGGCMVLQRRFVASRVLADVPAERITGMVAAATMLDMVRRELDDVNEPGGTQPLVLDSVRWLIFSQVSPTLFGVARELFPNARLIEGYGLTETCSGLTYLDQAHENSKQGSVGIAVPWVEVRVVDDNDEPVPAGVSGEVVARGPKVSPGYLDDAESTADTFRQGWFHTGDVGYLDSDGYLFIRDRLKDMIRSGGENMASAEIENVLTGHPLVLSACVVGAAHPMWQEVPVAFVIARAGLQAEDLVEYARSRLGKFKVPREIFLVDEFPTNPSGKVLKRSLREQRAHLVPDWVYPEKT